MYQQPNYAWDERVCVLISDVDDDEVVDGW